MHRQSEFVYVRIDKPDLSMLHRQKMSDDEYLTMNSSSNISVDQIYSSSDIHRQMIFLSMLHRQSLVCLCRKINFVYVNFFDRSDAEKVKLSHDYIDKNDFFRAGTFKLSM